MSPEVETTSPEMEMTSPEMQTTLPKVVTEEGEETNLVERWKVEGDGGGGRRI